MKSILMVLTGAKIWTMKNGTAHPTGFWAEEFIKPHKVFTDAGLKVTIATPGGVTPAVDALSLSLGMNNNDAGNIAGQQAYLKQTEAVLAATVKLEDVQAGSYDARCSLSEDTGRCRTWRCILPSATSGRDAGCPRTKSSLPFVMVRQVSCPRIAQTEPGCSRAVR